MEIDPMDNDLDYPDPYRKCKPVNHYKEKKDITGFGLVPIKAEGMPAHPDAYGIGYDNGDKFGSDKYYLKQLKAYADWRGIEQTKKEFCSRPHLLDQL